MALLDIELNIEHKQQHLVTRRLTEPGQKLYKSTLLLVDVSYRLFLFQFGEVKALQSKVSVLSKSSTTAAIAPEQEA